MKTLFPNETIKLDAVDFLHGSEYIDKKFISELNETRVKFYQEISAEYVDDLRIIAKYTPLRNEELIEDSIPFHLREATMRDYKNKKNLEYLPVDIEIKGTTLVMPLSTNSKSHFIFESMPYLAIERLYSIDNILFYTERNKNFEFIIDNYFNKKINYIYYSNENVYLEKSIVPKYRFSAHSSMKKTIDDIKNNLKKDKEFKSAEKIYISRQDSIHYRTLLNEDKVANLFKEYGFKILSLNNMDESLLIHYFLNARYIAGTIGAGLYNSIFSDKNTKLIGLNSPNYNLSFLDDCISLNESKRGYIFGPEFISFDDSHKGVHNNFLIGLDNVKEFLNKEF
jgi:hypothetical protein